MTPDRRWFPRRPTHSLVLVTLDPVNGGIPCNLARGGLALNLAQSVADGQLVTLRFGPPGSDDRIETGGEVVWTDDSGQIAGIRFLGLPQDSYQKIENWLSEGNLVATRDEKSTASQAAVGTAHSQSAGGQESASEAGRNTARAAPASSRELPRAWPKGEATPSTVEPPLATKADPLQGFRTVLEEAAVDAATSQPSKRSHLRVPEILLNPYARRRLIVSLSAAAVIASGLVFLLSYRELLGAGSGSWSIRSAVLEVENFIRGNDATSDGKPHQTPPNVVISKLPSRHHGDSAAERARRSAQSAEGIKPTGAIQPDEVINPATGQPRFNSEAQASKQLPAITILGSRQFPERPQVATLPARHSGIPIAPADPADPADPAPATAAGKFFVSQQISGSLPERPALLTYPVWARQRNLEGSVVVRATISQDGSVRSVRLVSGDPLLATAVLEAVSQWHYKPWTNGPAETETQITVTFTISTK